MRRVKIWEKDYSTPKKMPNATTLIKSSKWIKYIYKESNKFTYDLVGELIKSNRHNEADQKYWRDRVMKELKTKV